MSLKDKLDKLKESFKTKAPLDAQEIMHRATEDPKNSGIMDHVVKIGDKAPDFTLKDTELYDHDFKEVQKNSHLSTTPPIFPIISFHRAAVTQNVIKP